MVGSCHLLSEMTQKISLNIKKLLLVFTALSYCRSLHVSIPKREYEVARGEDVILTCLFIPDKPTFSILVLKWEAVPDNMADPLNLVATYILNNPTDIAPSYAGRVELSVDLDRNEATLLIKKVTMQDSRNYQCSITIPNDNDGILAASTSVLVLVPPSKPVCRMQGKAEYFHNISLSCHSEEGSPVPIYTWQSYSTQNILRPFPPRSTEKDGVLSLFNISIETSGFFVCTSTNRIGSASCNFTLSVMPPNMNIGATAGVIVGVLGGIIVLGIVIYCCCRKKDKGDISEVVEFHDNSQLTEYRDDESNSIQPQSNDNRLRTANIENYEDGKHSYNSNKEPDEFKGKPVDVYGGSRDRLDDQHDRYGGSHDRLDDHVEDRSDRYGGNRDRLDDTGNHYGGSRDRLDDHVDDRRDRYGGSRDRNDDHVDDRRDRYGGSREHLDDRRDRYGGSRDRLDDHVDNQRDRYGGSREHLDDRGNRYGGSRDRLDDHVDNQRDRYGGSREHLDNRGNRYGGSRDRLDV